VALHLLGLLLHLQLFGLDESLIQLHELLDLLLLLLLSQQLGFIVDDSEGVDLINRSLEFIDFLVFLVDEFVQTEQNQQLLLKRVE